MRNKTEYIIRSLILAVVLILGSGVFVSAATLSPSLNSMLDTPKFNDSLISIVIFADDENGRQVASAASRMIGVSRQVRHENAVNALRSSHRRTLSGIIDQINTIYPQAEIKQYWIAPVIEVTIPAGKLEQIMAISGIDAVYENVALELIEPVDDYPTYAGKTTGVASQLEALNVPAAWKLGLTGEGSLVCNFDTGVEGTHPALAANWHGNNTAASAAFFAPNSTDSLPFDATGHGTHTMGLMVGHNDVDTFGVAPGAEWISAAVVDQGQALSRTISDIIAAFQWAADPDGNPATVDDVPDVILNSWGIPTTVMEPCDETFYQVIDNVEAAGAVTIFAAGNEGPEEMTLRIPANRASSPLNAFSVGAIDHTTNTIASFSSRGPSSCNTDAKKPEVVAPGVNIYSSYKNASYTVKNGTSMAAPLIAGMVAILREYNPDATVDEIKSAIIASARDMGEPGEDNTYGYGLPDMMEALEALPAPPVENFEIRNQIIGGDGVAMPGETFDLYFIIERINAVVDSIGARLECANSDVTIINDRTTFYFDNKGFLSVSTNPFVLEFSDGLKNGQVLPLNLMITMPYGQGIDTVTTQITAGVPLNGTMLTHETPKLLCTVTDFGQIGLGDNSIFAAGGDGFSYAGSDNLMYESGIIIGRNSLQLSSSVRDSLGNGYNSDFSSVEPITIEGLVGEAGYCSEARFTDTGSDIPIPIYVNQKVTTRDQDGDDSYIIFEYYLVNNSADFVTNLYFGFMNDFDLNTDGDALNYVEDRNLLVQTDGLRYIGIRPLTEYSGMVSIVNDDGKIGLDNTEKYSLLSTSGMNINDTESADYITQVNFGPFYIAPHDSVKVAFTVVAADSRSDLEYYAENAASKYYGMTDVADGKSMLPQSFVLSQNYPNPFNPATSISFNLSTAANATLTVFNLLGQEVAVLFDEHAPAGDYIIEWNGTDRNGNQVGSGVYFYRLDTDNFSQTRKMMLLK